MSASGAPVEAFVQGLSREGLARVPAWEVMLVERASGGWSGALTIRPAPDSRGPVLDAAVDAGLAPGQSCMVVLTTANTAAPARRWTCTVTSLGTAPPTEGEPNPGCILGLADPISAIGTRAVHFGWGLGDLRTLLGGAASCAGGGRARPSRYPDIGAGITVRIGARVRDAIVTLPCAIACGEPLGEWLEAVCARLAIRIEVRTDTDGSIDVTARDATLPEPPRAHIAMMATYTGPPSARSMRIATARMESALPERAWATDSLERGDPSTIGPPGAIGHVTSTYEADLDDANRRREASARRNAAAQLRISGLSTHRAMAPGRIVRFIQGVPSQDDNREARLFGAHVWTVREVAHLYRSGRYVNGPTLEKDASWIPVHRAPSAPRTATAVAGAPGQAPGEPAARDQLGRIAVRMPPASYADAEDDPADIGTLALPLTAFAAGARHGFVGECRTGDICRVRVSSPLDAEIVGFVHRDDRPVKSTALRASSSVTTGRNDGSWRGIAFGKMEADASS